MKLFSCIVFFSFFLNVHAQYFDMIYTGGYWDKKGVEKDIGSAIRKAQKRNSIFSLNKYENGDTLIYKIAQAHDEITIKLTFNLNEYGYLYCDFQQDIFNTDSSYQSQLKEIKSLHGFLYRKENSYISQTLYRTELLLQDSTKRKDEFVLSFKYVNIPRKDYKALYKQLKRESKNETP